MPSIGINDPVFVKALPKKYLVQATLVALFAFSLLIAQLATTHHDTQHPFHKHTGLCDAFTAYDHSKTPLAQANTLAVAVEIFSDYIPLVVLSPSYNHSSVIRIRGPPSLLA